MSAMNEATKFSIAGILCSVLFALSGWTLYSVQQLERDETRIETNQHWIMKVLAKLSNEREDE